MPCNDWGSDYNTRVVDNTDYKKIDKLTALLCEACHLISNKTRMSRDLSHWWGAHEAADRERMKEKKEQEVLKQIFDSTMKKLSTQEVEALRRHFK